jgi:hypothetical protein
MKFLFLKLLFFIHTVYEAMVVLFSEMPHTRASFLLFFLDNEVVINNVFAYRQTNASYLIWLG